MVLWYPSAPWRRRRSSCNQGSDSHPWSAIVHKGSQIEPSQHGTQAIDNSGRCAVSPSSRANGSDNSTQPKAELPERIRTIALLSLNAPAADLLDEIVL